MDCKSIFNRKNRIEKIDKGETMALRTIRLQGDPVLNKVCREVKEVTPKIQMLIDDMLETMYDANGVGLAAPQVGVLKRIVVDRCRRRPARIDQSKDHCRPMESRPEDEGCLKSSGQSRTW